MTQVLIAGHGFVGGRLAALLMARSYAVTAIRRCAAPVAPGADLFVADMLQPETLVDLPACDVVIFAAAPREGSPQNYRDLYVQGVENLQKALPGSPSWFFVSSTSVYGQQDGAWVDESSPTEPGGYRGEIMLEAERQVLAFGSGNVVVRFSGIYGPGRQRLLQNVWDGVVWQKNPPRYTNRIHVDDCAGFLAHLVDRWRDGHKLEPCFLVSDDCPAPVAEVADWLAAQLGCRQPETTTECETNQGKRCSNILMKTSGYELRYPSFREGYTEMIPAFLAEHSARGESENG